MFAGEKSPQGPWVYLPSPSSGPVIWQAPFSRALPRLQDNKQHHVWLVSEFSGLERSVCIGCCCVVTPACLTTVAQALRKQKPTVVCRKSQILSKQTWLGLHVWHPQSYPKVQVNVPKVRWAMQCHPDNTSNPRWWTHNPLFYCDTQWLDYVLSRPTLVENVFSTICCKLLNIVLLWCFWQRITHNSICCIVLYQWVPVFWWWMGVVMHANQLQSNWTFESCFNF